MIKYRIIKPTNYLYHILFVSKSVNFFFVLHLLVEANLEGFRAD